MNVPRLFLTILLLQTLCGSFSYASDDDLVVVATYPTSSEYEADGARLLAILQDHHITEFCPQSGTTVSVNVAPSRATEARKLISEAITKEHLRVQIFP